MGELFRSLSVLPKEDEDPQQLRDRLIQATAEWCGNLFPESHRAQIRTEIEMRTAVGPTNIGQHTIQTTIAADGSWRLQYKYGTDGPKRVVAITLLQCARSVEFRISRATQDACARMPLVDLIASQFTVANSKPSPALSNKVARDSLPKVTAPPSDALHKEDAAYGARWPRLRSRSVTKPPSTEAPPRRDRVLIDPELRSKARDRRLTRLSELVRQQGHPLPIIFVRNREMYCDYNNLLRKHFSGPDDQIEEVFKVVEEKYGGKLTQRVTDRNQKNSIVLWPTKNLKKSIPLRSGFRVIQGLTPLRTLKMLLDEFFPKKTLG